jgi:hypothetical protein
MRKPQPRETVLPNGDLIKIKIAEQDWGYAEFVVRSGIKKRTLDKIVAGKKKVQKAHILGSSGGSVL